MKQLDVRIVQPEIQAVSANHLQRGDPHQQSAVSRERGVLKKTRDSRIYRSKPMSQYLLRRKLKIFLKQQRRHSSDAFIRINEPPMLQHAGQVFRRVTSVS